MAQINVAGDTSGSVAIVAPAIASTPTLTLPTVSGTFITTGSSGQVIPKAALPTGSVIQVVQTTTSTTTSSSSTTPSPVTGMSLSITPSSASNRILVLMSSNEVRAELNTGGILWLYRNGSSLGRVANEIDFNYTGVASFHLGMAWSYQYLDSPASTSPVTYALFLARLTGSGAFTFNTNSQPIGSSLILMEIVA